MFLVGARKLIFEKLLFGPISRVPSIKTLVLPPPCFGMNMTMATVCAGSNLKLHNLQPTHKKVKPRRLGRGPGNGLKSGGRGRKGQGKFGNSKPRRGFSIGQSDLIKRTPKYGFSRRKYRSKLTFVRLDLIQRLIETGRLDASRSIGLRELETAGVAVGRDGIVCTAKGGCYLDRPIDIRVTRFTRAAIHLIESQGGRATALYHSRNGVLAVLRGDKKRDREKGGTLELPLHGPPKNPVKRRYYFSYRYRGYLSPPKLAELIMEPIFLTRYIILRPCLNYLLRERALFDEYRYDLGVNVAALPEKTQSYLLQQKLIGKLLHFISKYRTPENDKNHLHVNVENVVVKDDNNAGVGVDVDVGVAPNNSKVSCESLTKSSTNTGTLAFELATAPNPSRLNVDRPPFGISLEIWKKHYFEDPLVKSFLIPWDEDKRMASLHDISKYSLSEEKAKNTERIVSYDHFDKKKRAKI